MGNIHLSFSFFADECSEDEGSPKTVVQSAAFLKDWDSHCSSPTAWMMPIGPLLSVQSPS